MYRVTDPVFAMAESSFLDGGSRLDDVEVRPLTAVSDMRSVARFSAALPNVGRYLIADRAERRAHQHCLRHALPLLRAVCDAV